MSQEGNLRIAVDFPWDASACMGTGAYSESMVRALAMAAPEAALILVVPLGTPRRIILPNVTYASLPVTEGITEGARQIGLPSFLAAQNVDCLFSPASLLPAIKLCPTVATIHDLAFETHPAYYAPALREILDRWFPVTLSSADRLIAISESVKQDLLFRKRINPARVTVIEQPVRETFLEPLRAEEAREHLRRLGVTQPFFFHVSNLAPHKNMEFAVGAFAEYLRRHPDARHELLFAGGGFAPAQPPDLIAQSQSLGIGGRVRYVGKVSDPALKALYQSCDAFLFPSLVEGWGLPVVEARAMGARVMASPQVPSALRDERVTLDREAWVEALHAPPRGETSSASVADACQAGSRLFETILEAIRAGRKDPPKRESHFPETPSAPRQPAVAIRGDWHSPSGFGEAARGVYRALESTGLLSIASAVPKDAIQDKRLFREDVVLGGGQPDLWIHHVPPDYMDLDLPGRHASFFFWETDRLPEAVPGRPWVEILSDLDEVWAPSEFVQGVLERSGVRSPVVRIFPPVDTELYLPGARRIPPFLEVPQGFDPSWTVFLYVGTWDPRKRPDILVRSFSRAFGEKDHALLLLKTYVTGDPQRDERILGEWVAKSKASNAHVRFIPRVLSPAQMAELYRFATAFATASRGEGYCLPAVQAMSSGRPVVAPGWSSFKDLEVLEVAYRLESIPKEVSLPGYGPAMHWAVVDEQDLAAKLRFVHEHRNRVRELGRSSRNWVLDHAALSVAGKILRERIESLCSGTSQQQLVEVIP